MDNHVCWKHHGNTCMLSGSEHWNAWNAWNINSLRERQQVHVSKDGTRPRRPLFSQCHRKSTHIAPVGFLLEHIAPELPCAPGKHSKQPGLALTTTCPGPGNSRTPLRISTMATRLCDWVRRASHNTKHLPNTGCAPALRPSIVARPPSDPTPCTQTANRHNPAQHGVQMRPPTWEPVCFH